MSTATRSPTTEQLARRYGQAWNDHDLEAIVAMHAPGMVFHLHAEGFEPATTEEAVRQQFALFLSVLPDLRFATERLTVASDLFVHEYVMSGTFDKPLPIAGLVAEVGRRIAVPGVDVIPCEGGLVKRKDTYLDGLAMLRQLGIAS
jgi:steroid delta-isomerase-like uncharacterized protein